MCTLRDDYRQVFLPSTDAMTTQTSYDIGAERDSAFAPPNSPYTDTSDPIDLKISSHNLGSPQFCHR